MSPGRFIGRWRAGDAMSGLCSGSPPRTSGVAAAHPCGGREDRSSGRPNAPIRGVLSRAIGVGPDGGAVNGTVEGDDTLALRTRLTGGPAAAARARELLSEL